MIIRGQFDIDLSQLKEEIMLLGSMVEKAFEDTMMAIKEKEYAKLDDIILNDQYINQLELEINEKATLMIAKQQPVASDLRKIIVSLKVSSDLERMGDLTVDIAKAAKRFKNVEQLNGFEDELQTMAEKAKVMMTSVFHAYRGANVMEAQKIAAMDDEIDTAYSNFVKSIFEVVAVETGVTEHVTQLAYTSRFIERIADYCTNVAEWIIYEVNGKRFDLN
ncbi:phosphate signaling complex protein PhoU [Evansella sp. AB-P1]|uniref:phosphate signaling complex protein PhoU n=1 Tax=Evansella sp. AB-P1 TaxID=3037653 RepID=UPI0024204796|nr:phosphate signaling complex protein PhoU [Evansella sp. AB-P1]MDG5786833.1 phosphate signaling complex protein PhoU [Evansella sp. AB-P1]